MLRAGDSGDVTKCWLSPDELSRLKRVPREDGWERETAYDRCDLTDNEIDIVEKAIGDQRSPREQPEGASAGRRFDPASATRGGGRSEPSPRK